MHRFSVLVSMIVFGCGLLLGQGDATITGSVVDATKSAIAGVDVTAKNEETGAVRKTVTDVSGHYDLSLLTVGRWEIRAEHAGFRSQSRGVNLVLGQRAEVDFALDVGEFRETLEITERAAGVEVTTADVSGLVGERQVKDLPLNGRSFDNLLTLNTGIVNVTAGRAGGVGNSAAAVGNMFSVSGHRPEANLFLLNGVEYTGSSQVNVNPGGASGQLLGVDAIREFELVKDNYGAEYGKRSGAQITIVTTSGTNQMHGSAYEFLRNSALDARNFFDQKNIGAVSTQCLRRIKLGGPIKKNKTFIFGNYEGFRQRLGLSNVTLVPDNAARAAAVASVQPLLNLWPLQNGPELGGGIAISYNSPKQAIREDFGTTRFDHNFTGNDTLAGVFTIDDSGAHTPSVNPLSSVDLTVRNQVASLSESHVFSPRIVNKLTLGFSRAAFFFNGTVPVDVPGFVQGNPIGALSIGGSTALNSSSQISLAGTNGNSNLRSTRNLFTLTDQVGITRGIHTLSVGFWLQQLQSNDNLAANQNGQAVFSSLQSFLQGTIATFTVIPNPTALSFRSLEGAYYAEDVMKFTAAQPGTADRVPRRVYERMERVPQPFIQLVVRFQRNHPNQSAGRQVGLYGQQGEVLTFAADRIGMVAFLEEHRDSRRFRNLLHTKRFDQLPADTKRSVQLRSGVEKHSGLGRLHCARRGAAFRIKDFSGGRAAGPEYSGQRRLFADDSAGDHAVDYAERGLRRFARLSRTVVDRRQHADSDLLSECAVPGRLSRRSHLLRTECAAVKSEPGQYDTLVFVGHKPLQRIAIGLGSPAQPWFAVPGRLYVFEEPGQRVVVGECNLWNDQRVRDESVRSAPGLWPVVLRYPAHGLNQRDLRHSL